MNPKPPPRGKSGFLDKVLLRLNRLDPDGLRSVVQRLWRERTLLETLFNTIEDGVLVTGPDGRVQYVNHAAARLLGIAIEGALNQPLTRLLPELGSDQLQRIEAGQVIRRELEIRFPRPRFLRVYAAPIADDSGAGLALVLHDTTELHQQTREVVEAERVHALTQLAASVAHEIGNPLNALSIHLQLMEREIRKLRADADPTAVADRLESYVHVAQGEIGRLDYIITEFLHAMRPTPPKFAEADLNAIVHDTLELLRPELENRRLRLDEQLASHLPRCALDAAQVKQALMNLIKNAMQAMTKEGTLTLTTGSTPEQVWVTVRDTGCGIPREELNRLFQPFHTTKEKGTGLGLMIVQRIVRDHGGRIDFDSEVGRGTQFRLWFPRADAAPRMLPST